MAVLLKFAVMMLIIMAVIFFIAVLTPRLAGFFEKHMVKPDPERVDQELLPEQFQVKGPYDKSELEGFDPNYKIYNTDIYGSESLDRLKNRKRSSSVNSERNNDNG